MKWHYCPTGEVTLSDRQSSDRPRHIGGNARLLAGFYVLDLEIAPVGDSFDPFDAECVHRRLDRGSQKAKVEHLVADLLFGDQLMFRIHSKLDVAADADLGNARHGAGVRVCQRDLVITAAIQFLQRGLVPGALAPDRRDLLGQLTVTTARAAAGAFLLGVAVVEALHVVRQLLVRLADKLRQCGAGEVAILVVHRLDARAIVDRQQLPPEKVELAAQDHELAEHLPESRTVHVRSCLQAPFFAGSPKGATSSARSRYADLEKWIRARWVSFYRSQSAL
jgi:hypothetical protein